MTRQRIKSVLRKSYGDFSTFLEHEYEKTIIDKLMLEKYDEKLEWATYNQILVELKRSLKDVLLVKEMQYRITNDENPKKVCLDVIDKSLVKTPELERLYNKVIDFILNP